MIHSSRQQTSSLREEGYWASYNRPAYEEHQEKVGGNEKVAEFGDWFTHGDTARAKIFRRDQHKVHTQTHTERERSQRPFEFSMES